MLLYEVISQGILNDKSRFTKSEIFTDKKEAEQDFKQTTNRLNNTKEVYNYRIHVCVLKQDIKDSSRFIAVDNLVIKE